MIKSILSLVLLLASSGLSLKHGWDALHVKDHPESAKMMTDLGINAGYIPAFGVFTILVGLLQLIPKTFFLGNLLSAFSIVAIMALALKADQTRIALVEIPFLLMPLVLIWLKYPFKGA